MMRAVAFLLLFLSTCSNVVGAFTFDKEGNAIEPASSAAFPAHLGTEKLDLVGMAVRVKRIVFVDFKVYAVGLYIDSKNAATKLPQLKGVDSSEFKKDSYDAVLNAGVPSALRLVMLRSVTGEQMGSAIGEAVESRLKALVADKSVTEQEAATAAFKSFRGLFSMAELPAGTELVFTVLPGKGLGVAFGAGQNGTIISSDVLSMALMDVYLGEDAVVDKAALLSNLKHLIA